MSSCVRKPPVHPTPRHVIDVLGRSLGAFYSDVAWESLPDRFFHLLDAMDQKERAASCTGARTGAGKP